MTKQNDSELKEKIRMRSEIVEAMQGLHRLGRVDAADLEQTTLRMLGRDALPKIRPMKPRDILNVRKKAKVSQAVLAASMNVAVSTVSQWERGERHPTGAALKLLHVIDSRGLGALR